MLCYAWRQLDSQHRQRVGVDHADNLTDLFGRILVECVNDLIEHGLWRDYIESTEEMAGLRGKLLVSPTIQKSLFKVGRAICATNEYSLNNRFNQLVLATIHAMIMVPTLDKAIRLELEKLTISFRGVTIGPVTYRDFLAVRSTRTNRHYFHVLRVCALIWEQLAPDDSRGKFIFEEFNRDEKKMRRVFEEFVRNFYKIECDGFEHIKAENLHWRESPHGTSKKTLLPIMKTDISLMSSDGYTVIETKFVPEALQQRVVGSEKIRSGHLYQLMAYLENIRRKRNIDPKGILLYPRVDRDIDERYRIWDLDVQIRTIDLTQEWTGIRRDLLDLVSLDKAA